MMTNNPFQNRTDVDKDHILKIGSVTVCFLKESDGQSLKKATKLLIDAYENRMKTAA